MTMVSPNAPGTDRRLLDLPAAVARAPAYDRHLDDECGNCVHHRRYPAGLPLPDGWLGETGNGVEGGGDALLFWRGLGHCTVAPPAAQTGGPGVYPVTHVSWTCRLQTTPADVTAAAAAAGKANHHPADAS